MIPQVERLAGDAVVRLHEHGTQRFAWCVNHDRVRQRVVFKLAPSISASGGITCRRGEWRGELDGSAISVSVPPRDFVILELKG